MDWLFQWIELDQDGNDIEGHKVYNECSMYEAFDTWWDDYEGNVDAVQSLKVVNYSA